MRERLLLGGTALLILAGLAFAFRAIHKPVQKQEPLLPQKIARPAALPVPVKTFPKGRGKIAIVLDDWGYGVGQLPYLKTIREPLTVSVLPNLPYSTRVAQEARRNGHEVILHMPMEPLSAHEPREAHTLSTGMTKEEVSELLGKSLATVPRARGINNHQGSKATADPALMRMVLKEVKRRKLFFLDSFVTDHSVCGELSKELGLKFAKRLVFLDNDPDPEAIWRSLEQLARLASQRGEAVAIGHDRPHTLRVLQEAAPALRRAGYRLVYASQLARQEEAAR